MEYTASNIKHKFYFFTNDSLYNVYTSNDYVCWNDNLYFNYFFDEIQNRGDKNKIRKKKRSKLRESKQTLIFLYDKKQTKGLGNILIAQALVDYFDQNKTGPVV